MVDPESQPSAVPHVDSSGHLGENLKEDLGAFVASAAKSAHKFDITQGFYTEDELTERHIPEDLDIQGGICNTLVLGVIMHAPPCESQNSVVPPVKEMVLNHTGVYWSTFDPGLFTNMTEFGTDVFINIRKFITNIN